MEPVVAGHPLHPALVTLPVGLFPASYALDILAMTTGNEKLAQAAYYNMVIGCVGALPAALAGFLDYRQMDQKDPAQNTAKTHGWLNAGLIGLYGLNLLVRRKNKRSFLGFLLSTIGTAGLLVSGYLGGELAYGRGWRVRAAERFELEWQKQHKTGPFAEGDHSNKTTEEEFPPQVIKAFRELKSGQAVFDEIKNSEPVDESQSRNGLNTFKTQKQSRAQSPATSEEKPEAAQAANGADQEARIRKSAPDNKPSQAEGERDMDVARQSGPVDLPSQAEGDRDTIEADLNSLHQPNQRPQALG